MSAQRVALTNHCWWGVPGGSERIKKWLAGEVFNEATHIEELALLAKDSNICHAVAEANAVKTNAAVLDGLIKFFEVIAAEILATVGGGAVEMANALAERLVYAVDGRCD